MNVSNNDDDGSGGAMARRPTARTVGDSVRETVAGTLLKAKELWDTPQHAADLIRQRTEALLWLLAKLVAAMWAALLVMTVLLALAVSMYTSLYWYVIPTGQHSMPVFFHTDSAPPFRVVAGRSLHALSRDDGEGGVSLPRFADESRRGRFVASAANVVAWATTNLVGAQWQPSEFAMEHLAAAQRNYRDKTHLLTAGHAYDVVLDVVLPDSHVNQRTGTAMVHVDVMCQLSRARREGDASLAWDTNPHNVYRLTESSSSSSSSPSSTTAKSSARDNGEVLMASSSRPIVVTPYSSVGVRWFWQAMFAVPLALGWKTEERRVQVALMEDLVEDSTCRASRINVTVTVPLVAGRGGQQARSIEIYDAQVIFNAQLYGVRHVLHHWFFSSAFFGTALLFASEVSMLAITIAVVWYLFFYNGVTDDDHDDNITSSGFSGSTKRRRGRRPAAAAAAAAGGDTDTTASETESISTTADERDSGATPRLAVDTDTDTTSSETDRTETDETVTETETDTEVDTEVEQDNDDSKHSAGSEDDDGTGLRRRYTTTTAASSTD